MDFFDYKWLNNATWSNDVLNLVGEIHELKGRGTALQAFSDTAKKKLTTTAFRQSVEASNRIEGITTSAPRLKLLIAGSAEPKNISEQQILGYSDALKAVNENFHSTPLRVENIQQMHQMVYGHTKVEFAGNFKQEDNCVCRVNADGSKEVIFQPVPAVDTPAAMDELCAAAMETLEDGAIEPLVVIPVFILDFLCIHPFEDGNGRVSRLLTSLLLYQAGHSIGQFISLDRLIDQTRPLYYRAISDSNQGWHENANDYSPFILYMLTTFFKAYKELDEKLQYTKDTGLRSSEKVRLAICNQTGPFTKVDLMRELPSIGHASIENAIRAMVKDGALSRYGAGPSTYYTKNFGTEEKSEDG